MLDRHGLVERRGRLRPRAQGTPLSLGQRPNELWCTDYKGEFLLANRQYCYPLTVTDHASRFLLTCEALSSTREDYAFTVFERLFQERGLPANIRSDNGVPFASAHGTVFSLATGLGPFVSFVRNPAKVGQQFGILGYGLSGASGVVFNGISARFTAKSDTLLIATVPSGATTGYVTVITAGGTLTSNVPFRVIH